MTGFATLRSALAVCITLVASSLIAQTPIAQMYHKSWTVRDGTPSGIEGGVQGPDGFLWWTTRDGLYRFDGVSFTRYQPARGGRLLHENLNDIYVGRDGSIWIGYMLGSVSRIKEGEITHFTEKEGLKGGHIGSIGEDLDGRVWIAGTQGLQFIHDSHITRYEDGSAAGKSASESLTVDSAGNVWVALIAKELLVLRRGANKFTVASERPLDNCEIAKDEGVLCYSTSSGQVSHFFVSDSKVVSQSIAHIPSPQSLLQTIDGAIWLGTVEHGIQLLPSIHNSSTAPVSSEREQFDKKDGLTNDSVQDLFQDREGSIWVATLEGLDQFRPVPFSDMPLGKHIALPSNESNQRFVIAAERLAEVRDGQTKFLYDDGLRPNDFVRSLYQAGDGTIWLGRDHGFSRYRKERLEDIPLPKGVADHGFPAIQTMVEDADRGMWISIGGNGLWRFADEQWQKNGGYSGLPTRTAMMALRDQRGSLWFGYQNNVLARIISGEVTTFDATKGLQIGAISALTDWNDQVWIGGELGLVVFERGAFHKVHLSGLENMHGVTGLIFSKSGNLWISSNSGVIYISHEQLANREKGPDYALQNRIFNYLDGVLGIPGVFAGNPSLAFGLDGKLYAATVSLHLQWIDPEKLPFNSIPPQVWIMSVESGAGGMDSDSKRITLNPQQRNVSIGYTATSLLIPERVRFRYRLLHFDKDWVDAGTRRQAFYTKLPAGRYTFQVIACNDSGLWNQTGATLMIDVPPSFWETIWFKLCLVVIFCVLLFYWFRLRLRHTQRRVEERMYERFAERERIAREFHDTVFQGIEGSLLHLNAVTSRLPVDQDARDRLREAYGEADRVMSQARGLVFNLRRTMEFQDLAYAVTSFAEQVGQLSEAKFALVSTGEKQELRPSTCDEVLKIIKECIWNAFRHASAKNIQVQLTYSLNVFAVRVLDDGSGINPIILAQGGRDGHWGLAGIRERAAKLKASLTIQNRESGGTEVCLLIDSSVAYLSRAKAFSLRWLRAPLGARSDAE